MENHANCDNEAACKTNLRSIINGTADLLQIRMKPSSSIACRQGMVLRNNA